MNPPPRRRERDLRAYARSTQVRLAAGAILLLFMVGDGLIWLIYGPAAGRQALICTGVGLLPLVLIAGWLWLVGWIARKAKGD